MSNTLRRFVTNIGACYSWRNILWQLLAVALTYLIVASGFDWWYYTHARSPVLQSWLFPAAILGGLVPIFLPLLLFFMKKMNTAFAVVQAAIIGLFISSFYKIFAY